MAKSNQVRTGDNCFHYLDQQILANWSSHKKNFFYLKSFLPMNINHKGNTVALVSNVIKLFELHKYIYWVFWQQTLDFMSPHLVSVVKAFL
jgi:hypothetical protein